ncbi:hypothetical protein JK151_08820 [Ralstonia syzygii subsp. celebesensis]|uniref:Uncharacterized protein n=2 Tax=Ralstonia syzygii subsp. celebesensis TaxID=1310168 RepID=A0A1U9VG21_9RALS|nr:hypothetical protein [Ralstonia syzygii]AQW29137.1 hypothetical protein B0B51_03310 [blood disease bacterium A2-HR MARDI]QQV54323.1 hypothetical protein JK151_08820 [Ralstonia syzygii subsp. celebesensis]CCA79428.1 conserved hypothetical protein [blood disease bacterium R229]
MTLSDVIKTAIAPALAILPSAMDTKEARVMLLSIGLQESRFMSRRQIGGPARGSWQFEEGTKQTCGGVWGVYLHDASRYWLDRLCASRGVLFQPDAIYRALEGDDVLAAGLARLMLFTDPKRLPAVTDADGAWSLYLRTWRPGKPRRDSWNALHEQARTEVTT